jgi:toxin ParE1/3/4
MKQFILTKSAQRDLVQIKRFLLAKAGPVVSRRVLGDIRKSFILLEAVPGIGHRREDLTSRGLKFWPVFSYLVVYDPNRKPLEIVRVLHGMRNLEDILH